MKMADGLSIFDISGRAMAAQLVRLNTSATNLANAGTVSGSEAKAFRAMKPVFQTVMGAAGQATVQVERIDTSTAKPVKRHDPNHPLADKDGNIWEAAVDSTAEMVEMQPYLDLGRRPLIPVEGDLHRKPRSCGER